jgi:hypothetical protein
VTSNILGILPNLEKLVTNYHDYQTAFTSNKQKERDQHRDVKLSFLKENPIQIDIYLLDNLQIVNKDAEITQKYVQPLEPTNEDIKLTTELFRLEPGSDDYHGNWRDIRGNELQVGNENRGQIIYAHNSNKPLSKLINNPRRQEKVLFKTWLNAQTYLHEKVMSYDARELGSEEISKRAKSIRGLMGVIGEVYSRKSQELNTSEENIWTHL